MGDSAPNDNQPDIKVRLDKWLWAVRIYKTRSNATEACKAGHVKLDGTTAKPSHIVRVGQSIEARVGDILRVVKVTGLLEKRVGAKLVPDFLEDHSPVQEKKDNVPRGFHQIPVRSKGAGRPTKKERRQLDSFEGP